MNDVKIYFTNNHIIVTIITTSDSPLEFTKQNPIN